MRGLRVGAAAVSTMLLLTGCAFRGKKVAAVPPPVVELPKQEAPKGGVAELEQAKQPAHLRVLALLAEADTLRNAIFASPDMQSLFILFDRLDAEGQRIAVNQNHASYSDTDNLNRIARAAAIYETVLGMDPGKPQALLGLANLSMIHAMSLLTDRTILTYRLRMSDSTKERTVLLRQRRMVKRKLRTALLAAQSKLQDVLSFSPRDPSAQLGLAMVMAMAGRWPDARTKLAEIEQERMHPPRARSVFYLWYGFVEEAMGDSENAIKHYAQAAQLREPIEWADWAGNRVEEMYLYGVVQMAPPDEEDMQDGAVVGVRP